MSHITQTDWRELCRRLYVELFHVDQQLCSVTDENDEPVYRQGSTVRDALKDASAALAQPEPISETVKSKSDFCILFPRHTSFMMGDWTISPAFITRVMHTIDPEAPYDFIPSMEQVEQTLLALEVIPTKEFTRPMQSLEPMTNEELYPITDEDFFSSIENAGLVIDPILAMEIRDIVEHAYGIKSVERS